MMEEEKVVGIEMVVVMEVAVKVVAVVVVTMVTMEVMMVATMVVVNLSLHGRGGGDGERVIMEKEVNDSVTPSEAMMLETVIKVKGGHGNSD
jgi:hypothetical protein